jgi:homoserine O-acetyltransferase
MLHQGTKFTHRFDANSYLRIVEAWQNFVCPLFDPLAPVTDTAWTHIPFLIFTIDSDVCFYPEEQEKLARLLTEYGAPCLRTTVHSDKGHDAFLLEPELFAPHLHYFLNR